MFTLIMIATCVPALGGVSYFVMRNRRPQVLEDVRGIALQTVIVIVVLLAIAGAVAGVLVTRGGEAVDSLEETDIMVDDPTEASTETECDLLGGTWDANTNTCS